MTFPHTFNNTPCPFHGLQRAHDLMWRHLPVLLPHPSRLSLTVLHPSILSHPNPLSSQGLDTCYSPTRGCSSSGIHVAASLMLKCHLLREALPSKPI